MFTKTALNKIKKADLVQMYLDLQAKDYYEKMEETLEKCCNNAIEEVVKSMKDVIEEVKAENEKLKEDLEEAFDKGWEAGKSDTHDEIDLAVSAHVKRIEELEDEKQKMSSMAYANGLDINPTDEDLEWMGRADEEEYEKKEDDTIKEVMNDIINQVEEKESEKEEKEEEWIWGGKQEIITDGYGNQIKVPSEEVCMKMFGVSKEVFIMTAKQSNCSGY